MNDEMRRLAAAFTPPTFTNGVVEFPASPGDAAHARCESSLGTQRTGRVTAPYVCDACGLACDAETFGPPPMCCDCRDKLRRRETAMLEDGSLLIGMMWVLALWAVVAGSLWGCWVALRAMGVL